MASKSIQLQVKSRAELGSRANKKLRDQGLIPAESWKFLVSLLILSVFSLCSLAAFSSCAASGAPELPASASIRVKLSSTIFDCSKSLASATFQTS